MKNEQLYNKTIDILVQAYLNDTLAHGTFTACAVGNICAANMGTEVVKLDGSRNKFKWANHHIAPSMGSGWPLVFVTSEYCQRINMDEFAFLAEKQIKSTGYAVLELAQIEFAFETASKGNSSDEWMFNGLMAVIDVLDKIHDNTDTKLTHTTKLRFAQSTQS